MPVPKIGETISAEEFEKLPGEAKPIAAPAVGETISAEEFAELEGAPTTAETIPEEKKEGIAVKAARLITPLGESVGTGLAAGQAKRFETEVSARQQELANVAVRLIKRPDLTPEQKRRALVAIQSSADVGVISQSGAFEETAGQTFGKGLQTAGSVLAGSGAGLVRQTGLRGAAGLAARTGAEATLGAATFGAGGGLAKEQRGGELAKTTLTAGLISGAANLAGEFVGATADYLTKKLPAKSINNLIRPHLNEYRFGKNPGQAIVDEGLVANTREGLLKEIFKRRSEVGAKIGSRLTAPEVVGKELNIRNLLTPIETAKQQAIKTGNQALFDRINNLEGEIGGLFAEEGGKIIRIGSKRLHNLSPEAARILKTELGESAKWTGQVFDQEINQVKVQIYRNIDKAIDALVPGIEKLNNRYANLLTAEKALERTIHIADRNNLIGLREAGLAAASLATGNAAPLAGAVGLKAASSSAFQTRLAQILKKAETPSPAKDIIAALKQMAFSALQNKVSGP